MRGGAELELGGPGAARHAVLSVTPSNKAHMQKCL